eukprot:m.46787 g.46787  ORF g.46787 m.46787 type:complete len:708 (+) comp13177_c0_seq1:5-2128(+)
MVVELCRTMPYLVQKAVMLLYSIISCHSVLVWQPSPLEQRQDLYYFGTQSNRSRIASTTPFIDRHGQTYFGYGLNVSDAVFPSRSLSDPIPQRLGITTDTNFVSMRGGPAQDIGFEYRHTLEDDEVSSYGYVYLAAQLAAESFADLCSKDPCGIAGTCAITVTGAARCLCPSLYSNVSCPCCEPAISAAACPDAAGSAGECQLAQPSSAKSQFIQLALKYTEQEVGGSSYIDTIFAANIGSNPAQPGFFAQHMSPLGTAVMGQRMDHVPRRMVSSKVQTSGEDRFNYQVMFAADLTGVGSRMSGGEFGLHTECVELVNNNPITGHYYLGPVITATSSTTLATLHVYCNYTTCPINTYVSSQMTPWNQDRTCEPCPAGQVQPLVNQLTCQNLPPTASSTTMVGGCLDCAGTSHGPCQAANSVCYLLDGNKCPPNTLLCANASSTSMATSTASSVSTASLSVSKTADTTTSGIATSSTTTRSSTTASSAPTTSLTTSPPTTQTVTTLSPTTVQVTHPPTTTPSSTASPSSSHTMLDFSSSTADLSPSSTSHVSSAHVSLEPSTSSDGIPTTAGPLASGSSSSGSIVPIAAGIGAGVLVVLLGVVLVLRRQAKRDLLGLAMQPNVDGIHVNPAYQGPAASTTSSSRAAAFKADSYDQPELRLHPQTMPEYAEVDPPSSSTAWDATVYAVAGPAGHERPSDDSAPVYAPVD